MDKKEKEARLEEHINYWNLVDKLRDVSLNALDNLSVSDVISALDRIKTELTQQEAIMIIEEGMKGEEGDESEESDAPVPHQVDLQTTMPMVDPAELLNEIKKAVNN